MTEILLMRHAKSEHPAGMADRDRPLSPRGERSAAAVGRAITAFGAKPDLVLTSPARRAAATAELAAAAGDWNVTPIEVEALYGAAVDDVLRSLRARSGHSRILAVGHEPTWSETVSALVGGGSIRMVTAAVACVEVPDPTVGSGWLRWMLHPRLLRDDPA